MTDTRLATALERIERALGRIERAEARRPDPHAVELAALKTRHARLRERVQMSITRLDALIGKDAG